VAERAPDRVRPGPILDDSGKELGRHAGIHGFTLGQRRNLGVAVGHRAYVVDINAGTGSVALGDKSRLAAQGALLGSVSLAEDVSLPRDCHVEVRYRGTLHAARVVGTQGGARVDFKVPVSPVVKGQFAVFYEGDRVLGGGEIRESLAAQVFEEASP
jgi:tRNA-specific 2-thiouridylase